MRNLLLLLLLISSTIFYAQIKYGRNDFTTISEGVEREYVVHIPKKYDGTQAVPLIFMLHGTGGSGPDFYENFGWKDLCEIENFIVVYPSSLRYKIIDNDGPKVTFKWNTLPDGGYILQPGEVGKDDILFFRKVINEISAKYMIDAKRIYMNGFSNGGSMASKCAIDMGDVLAAVCQNASSFFQDTTFIPKRKLPILYEVGNKDYGPGNEGPSIPMNLFDSLISTPNIPYLNGKHYRIANLTQRNFELQSEHTIEGDSNVALVATFLPKPNTGGYEFKYIMVKNLAHNYPNGAFHPYNAPKHHWNWMKQFTLEEPQNNGHKLNIINGYGSGSYYKGDTVHIWAGTPPVSKTFRSWSGDIGSIEEKSNWHTTFIMPDHDVNLVAEYYTLPENLNYKGENIQGPYSKKEVFSYFPAKNKIKGIVWLFAGAKEVGKKWVSNIEESSLLDLMVANDFGVITIDAEEVTQNKDINNDGALAFHYTLDSLKNPDLANINFLKNYFIKQGKFDSNTPQIAIGFSSGGGFAEVLASVNKWACSLSHNTAGINFLAENSTTPHYQNNSFHDDGPLVGPEGNTKAKANLMKYASRNIKNKMIMQYPQPLYAERFTRISRVNEDQSKAIYNFIKQKGLLNDEGYLKINPSIIQEDFESHPQNYPALQQLPKDLVINIFTQLKVIYTTHIFRSDYNGSVLKFIKESLAEITSVEDNILSDLNTPFFYPNPAANSIYFNQEMDYMIFDLSGKLLLQGRAKEVNLNDLNTGLHIVKVANKMGKLVVIR